MPVKGKQTNCLSLWVVGLPPEVMHLIGERRRPLLHILRRPIDSAQPKAASIASSYQPTRLAKLATSLQRNVSTQSAPR